ncbi:MAG: serine/threonine protein kinase [Bdellovibrionales bacterium]|nr:serine/threonine protein kinase [Bdellovibrionales bacterium]
MSGDHFLNLQPGTIVNGRYEVVKCLGTGSMGMVYACRHRELAGHIVAMKVLFAEVARDEVAAARFRNEIVASYGVSHPNVVRAYEYFRDGDLIAFTMEYIGGGDLADRISSDDEIPIDEIVMMLCQMASGVQAIHDAGIIHRDLKPENILITSQGDIKITDFGIARTGTGPKLTEHGGVVGTIDYVSPEYLERGQVDRRSDIYALGVLAYEMITSVSPFKGKSVIETMTMRLRTDPEPPHHLRLDCPVALSTIILKAMARDPEERYQQAREMLEDLDALRRSRGIRVDSSSAHPIVRDSTSDERVLEKELPPLLGEGVGSELAMGIGGGAALITPFDGGESFPGFTSGERTSSSVQLGPNATGALAEPSDEPAFDLFEDFREPEKKVRPKVRAPEARKEAETPRRERPRNDTPPPSVAVSQSRLSTERMKELSLDLYQPASSVFRTVLSWMFIFFVGFGVGLLILMHYMPELFGTGEVPPPAGYVE